MLGLQSSLLAGEPEISHRFFGRVGGTSPHPWTGLNTTVRGGDAPARVEENLARVRFQIGIPRRALFVPEQVHGATVLRVGSDDDPEQVASSAADALFTTDPGIGIGVRTADCVPVLLTSRGGACVAAIHAGWRGAVAGIVAATVRALEDAGFPPQVWRAAVGPCIGPEAFEVGPEVIEAAASGMSLDGLVMPGAGDRMHLDLGALVERQLCLAGVPEVERIALCTARDTTRWFSHRAEGGRTGRQISVIARTRPPMLDEATFS